MDQNHPVPLSGLSHLWSYAGGLHILEILLDAAIIISMFVCGLNFKAYLFCGTGTIAAIITIFFLILHLRGLSRKSKWPWHWIECVSVLIVALILAISSAVIISIFTKGYIMAGVIGYLTSVVYFFDTFQKYQIAVAPVPRYAWTTPHMPELN